MDSFLSALLQLDPVAIIQTGGILGIAAVIFAESGLLIGVVFPGDSLLFSAGLLAATGYLPIVPLMLAIVAAAIIGDSTGYWIGAKTGPRLFTREESFFFKRSYVTRTEQFYAEYGGRSVILARFVPIVRTIAPMLAGMGTMPYARFLSYNVVGALLWGAGLPLLGYTLGALIPGSEAYILPISLGIIVLSFVPMLLQVAQARRAKVRA